MVKLYRVNSRERMTRQRWDEVPAVKWFQNVFTWKSKFFPDNFYDETRNRHHHKLRMNSNEIQHDERKKLSAWLFPSASRSWMCLFCLFSVKIVFISIVQVSIRILCFSVIARIWLKISILMSKVFLRSFAIVYLIVFSLEFSKLHKSAEYFNFLFLCTLMCFKRKEKKKNIFAGLSTFNRVL